MDNTEEQQPHTYVKPKDWMDFIAEDLEDNSVDLWLFDPPYFNIVKDTWDNQWTSKDAYIEWFMNGLAAMKPKLKPHASIVFFGGIGRHKEHPFFEIMMKAEELYQFRNMITWQKRRAYGTATDYLFCREEILWFSVSPNKKEITFNVPLTNIKRGYAGFSKKYVAKSEYKRVSNVFSDIPELFSPPRATAKPIALMERLVATHSNEGDLVVDTFLGYGTVGVAARGLGRRFLGCEAIPADAASANERIAATITKKAVPAKEKEESDVPNNDQVIL